MSMHIGIIGGMGTEAGLVTVKIICDTFRAKNLPYPKLTLISDETIPDRSAFLLGKSEQNPARKISLIGEQLLSLGVDHIIIACFTAHSPDIIDQVHPNVSSKLVSLFTPLRNLPKSNKRVGVLATNGSQKSAVFEFHFPACEIVYPDHGDQEVLMSSIYDIKKRGVYPKVVENIIHIASNMSEKVDMIVLGCTELLLLEFPPDFFIINPVKLFSYQFFKMTLMPPKSHLTT